MKQGNFFVFLTTNIGFEILEFGFLSLEPGIWNLLFIDYNNYSFFVSFMHPCVPRGFYCTSEPVFFSEKHVCFADYSIVSNV